MVSEIKKNWFRRHWILTTILVFFLIGVIGVIFEDREDFSNKKDSKITLHSSSLDKFPDKVAETIPFFCIDANN